MRKILLYFYGIFIFLLPLMYSFQTNQVFEINKLAFLLFFTGIASFLMAFSRASLPKFNKTFILWGMFLVSLIISTIFSVNPAESFWGSYNHHQGLLLYLAVFLLIFYVVLLRPNKKEIFYFFLLPLILTGVLQSIIAILEQFGIGFFSTLSLGTYQGRSIGTFGQPNFLARFLLFPFFISLHFLFNGKFYKTINSLKIPLFGLKKSCFKLLSCRITLSWLYILVILIIFAGIIVTDSRAGLLSLVLGIFIAILLQFKNKLLIFLIGISLFSGLFFVFQEKIYSRSEATETRILIWKNLGSIAENTPFVFGEGIDQQKLILDKIQNQRLKDLVDFRILDRAHNEFLDIFIMTGFLGLISYIFLLLGIILPVNKNNSFLMPIIASILARMFGFFSITEIFLFFLFLAFITKNEPRGTKKWSYLSILLLIFSLFFIYSAQNIFLADKYFYEGKTEKALKMQPSNQEYIRAIDKS